MLGLEMVLRGVLYIYNTFGSSFVSYFGCCSAARCQTMESCFQDDVVS